VLDYKQSISKNNVCLELPTLSDGYHVSNTAMKEVSLNGVVIIISSVQTMEIDPYVLT
ncbi:unnamed protein product, partial [Schistosoma turkestanicum]